MTVQRRMVVSSLLVKQHSASSSYPVRIDVLRVYSRGVGDGLFLPRTKGRNFARQLHHVTTEDLHLLVAAHVVGMYEFGTALCVGCGIFRLISWLMDVYFES